jgi:AAA domain, putative AbiEii toxin, Type IV TA system/AAA domain
MFISELIISNYKSFLKTEPLHLTGGFNIVTGQNNIGKTALLECLKLDFPNVPHRSQKTIPNRNAPALKPSNAEFRIILSMDELLQIFRLNQANWYIPIVGNYNDIGHAAKDTLDNFLGLDNLVFHYKYESNSLSFGSFPSYSENSRQMEPSTMVPFAIIRGPFEAVDLNNIQYGNAQAITEIGSVLFGIIRNRIYKFKAERYNIGISNNGTGTTLSSDGSNLPEVLRNLESNHVRFTRYVSLIQQILPQIRDISIISIPNQQVEIKIWLEDPLAERDDLAISLNQCGTGFSQVLAMVYVAITTELPSILLIDEPSSFLHPGAVRKLIDILKQFVQHQFIITTHSPNVISSASPSTITLLKRYDQETQVERVDVSQTNRLADYLLEIGARLSDVFGSDNILWVEGATEEKCFPLILELVAKRRLLGTSIVGVKHTGDFETAKPELIFDVYSKLSKAQGLLPPAIGFLFDREGKAEEQLGDLKKRSGGLIGFLPRRTYENYLLVPAAIASVINASLIEPDDKVTEAVVRGWIQENGSDNRYQGGAITADWEAKVHGALLLSDLFAALTDAKVEFTKTRHSVRLTEWIVHHDPEHLRELAETIRTRLDTAPPS